MEARTIGIRTPDLSLGTPWACAGPLPRTLAPKCTPATLKLGAPPQSPDALNAHSPSSSMLPSTAVNPLLSPPFTHALTHSLTYSLTHSLTHSHTHPLTHSLTHSLTHRAAGELFPVLGVLCKQPCVVHGSVPRLGPIPRAQPSERQL